MGITHIVTIAAISITGLLPASCRKSVTAKPSAGPVTTNATNNIAHDLGDVLMTNHDETCVSLGGGRNCTFSPKMLGGHDIQLTLTLESKTANGKTSGLAVTQLLATDGKPQEVSVDDFQLTFTPKMAAE